MKRDQADEQSDRDSVFRDFRARVNMSPKELEEWLESDESKSVGWGEGESVGHQSGRKIVAIKRKNKDELSADDFDHMQKVVGYIKRHCAQGPGNKAVETSRWRYSLMNWGHDPLKDHDAR